MSGRKLQGLKMTATQKEPRLNREQAFNDALNVLLQEGVPVSFNVAMNWGAHTFNCSQETIKRYLNKRLSFNGDLVRGKDNGLSIKMTVQPAAQRSG